MGAFIGLYEGGEPCGRLNRIPCKEGSSVGAAVIAPSYGGDGCGRLNRIPFMGGVMWAPFEIPI